MSSLETTELKLRTTPTAGVSGEHSPYYRRLLSAGYKGYLQGTLGGAGYYGLLGLGVGTLVGLTAAPFTGGASLLLIPVVAGAGVLKGAHTFGNIGSVAAISAESADLAEQRRYLLDRYYDLPEGPEGDKQAAIIKDELANQTNSSNEPRPLFHWKTVAICAVIGAAAALFFLSPLGFGLATESIFTGILGNAAVPALQAIAASTAGLVGIGGGLGALMGATIGIDRSYVRKWFDTSEKMLQDESHVQEATRARMAQIQRIKEAALADDETKRILERRHDLHLDEAVQGAAPLNAPAEKIAVTSVADLNAAPDTKVHSARLQNRLADIQKAMDIPAI